MHGTDEKKSLFSLLREGITKPYLLVHLLSFPFWGLLYLLPVILYKDLHASPFQVATLIALKPMASLLSPYWSQWIHGRPNRLISNLYVANILKFTPFFFVPLISNPWYYLFAYGFFMMLSRGTTPAWMEILKIHLPKNAREKVSQTGSTIDFLGTALLPLLFGATLDGVAGSWRWLFLAMAILGALSTLFILKIPKVEVREGKPIIKNPLSHLFAPWKSFKELLIKKPDFSRFQLGFFLGGTGLIIVQPILPNFFVDTLQLSYTGMLTAIAACKGIGFTLSSPLWVKHFGKGKIFTTCALVTGVAALFPLLLITSQWNVLFIYLAYLLYGVMQGGSELTWKMSGVTFAESSDSSPYTSINVLTVGLRGLIIPYLGSALFALSGNYYALMLLGSLFSIAATAVMGSYGRLRSKKI